MEKISAIIITYNEEDNIETCISSLKEISDEILVIDSKSKDRTRYLAQKLGATVVETEWRGYSDTKNFGNSIAKNDWILSIDADEVVSKELATNIQQLKFSVGHVYALDRLTNFCGKWIRHSGWYPEWKVRLFNKKTSQWEGEFVHESLHHSTVVQVKKLEGKLLHYSYKTLDDHLERIERYASLSAYEMQSKGKKSSFLKLWISPAFRFFKTYFIKLGFLDGKAGWIISKRNAWLVHLKYRILKDLTRQ